MFSPLSNQATGRDRVRRALSELKAGHGELQALVSGVFDRFDGFANEVLGRKGVPAQQSQPTQWDTLQREIDRLASVAAEMTKSAVHNNRGNQE
jgi:hypothetical protein